MTSRERAYYGEADLPTMFKEWGVECSIADQWYARGILDEADSTLLEDGVTVLAGRTYVLLLQTGSMGPLLKEGATITVDQVNYTVQSVMRQQDGAVTRVVILRQ